MVRALLKELGEKKKGLDTTGIRRLCRDYAEKYYRIQRDEFRRLGVQGDWNQPYLTMDPAYEAAILREFGKFVDGGGVYKGLKPVLWCMTDHTALAEAEVEYENHTSPSVYVKFPFVQSLVEVSSATGVAFPAGTRSAAVIIWTTTPWTLPANQALCLHPDFDYVFVDCPPSLGLLTVNALVAAHEVLIPIQCEYSALEGLGQLLRNIELVQSHLNPALWVSTILLTMYDGRTKLADQVTAEVRGHFGDLTLRTVIPRSVKISEAPGFGQTVLTYDPGSRGSMSYLDAAREIAERGAERKTA